MCFVKALNVALKDVEMILAGDLLCYSLPFFRFTLKHQEGVKHNENVAVSKSILLPSLVQVNL